MKKINLPARKRANRYRFRVANIAVRTDGKYCDCIIAVDPIDFKEEKTKGIIGIKVLGTNLDAIEMVLNDIAYIYPNKRDFEIEVKKCKSVLAEVSDNMKI